MSILKHGLWNRLILNDWFCVATTLLLWSITESSIKEEKVKRWSNCVKKEKEFVKNKRPSFLLVKHYFILVFFTFLLVSMHSGAENSSILSLEQNNTKLLPSRVAVTCVVHRERKQAMLHQLLSVGKHMS